MVKKLLSSKIHFIAGVILLIYLTSAISVSVNRYWQYQTFYFDFGIFDSALWKVSRFQLPFVDHVDFGDKNILILADHFSPSIFLLSPLYFFTDRREIMLIAQAVAVVVSAYVGFIIASNLLKNKLAPLALMVAFLGYVGIQNAIISDFHQDTVAILPLMALFWAIFQKRWKVYFLFLIIFLGFKESFAGLGVTIGLYLAVNDRKNIKIALATILISLLWGALTVGYIIPLLSKGVYLYLPKDLPSTFPEVISRFTIPLRLKAVFYSYLTFAFLPIFNLSILPSIFENLFERYVLSNRGSDLGMHYNATLAVFMFIGALQTLILIERKSNKNILSILAVLMVFIVIILHQFILRGPLALSYNRVFYEQNDRVKYVDLFVENFPKNGLIMTQNDLAVRLTHQDVKLLRKDYQKMNPDFIILNLTPGQNPNSFFPLSYEEAKILKDSLLLNPNYTLKKYTDEQYIFSKNN